MSKFFPSSKTGKTWSVSFYKPQGKPGYVSAIEGELKGGFFSFMLFESQSYKKTITGPCTAKKKAAAEAELLASMKAAGLLAEGVS